MNAVPRCTNALESLAYAPPEILFFVVLSDMSSKTVFVFSYGYAA